MRLDIVYPRYGKAATAADFEPSRDWSPWKLADKDAWPFMAESMAEKKVETLHPIERCFCVDVRLHEPIHHNDPGEFYDYEVYLDGKPVLQSTGDGHIIASCGKTTRELLSCSSHNDLDVSAISLCHPSLANTTSFLTCELTIQVHAKGKNYSSGAVIQFEKLAVTERLYVPTASVMSGAIFVLTAPPPDANVKQDDPLLALAKLLLEALNDECSEGNEG